ncbi:MAG TPA: galactose oxidase-like domain-containing protein [Mycobacteriales bacterium]|jgi:hypothetical protein|nr:galactose oxidase-like domain-containing protein [Mycobacteriales bacterium]
MPLAPRRTLLASTLLVLASALAVHGAPAPSVPLVPADPAVVGAWSTPQVWPVQAIAAAVLPTGKVLALSDSKNVVLWDPADGTLVPKPISTDVDIVCSGLAMLPDGRVLANGGHTEGTEIWNGIRASFVFDPAAEAWSRVADMATPRYYPATVTLADGRALTVNGNDGDGVDPKDAEVWDGTAWHPMPGVTPPMEFYPRLHVLPGGRLVRTGQDPEAAFLDPVSGTWTTGPASVAGRRWGGTSVLLPGLDRVLVFGGGNAGLSSEGHGETPLLRDSVQRIVGNLTDAAAYGPTGATASTEILDLRGAAPAYRSVGSLTLPRRDLAGVVLADGGVLALGGAAGFEPYPGWNDVAFQPELFDLATERWSLMAPAERTRGYHSTAVLLPDGRVLFAGGDFELARGTAALPLDHTGEVYSPPYLFRGPRPVVSGAPGAVSYGGSFSVRTSGAPVARAALVRLSSTTHSLNTDQRWVGLDATVANGLLRLRAPADPGAAPPGYYLLFALSDRGVPSVASIVRLG